MNKTCKRCGNDLQPWSTGKIHCNWCGSVYDINEDMVTYIATASSKPYSEKDTCICCGKYIPEGRQVCQECEERNYNGREPWNK